MKYTACNQRKKERPREIEESSEFTHQKSSGSDRGKELKNVYIETLNVCMTTNETIFIRWKIN